MSDEEKDDTKTEEKSSIAFEMTAMQLATFLKAQNSITLKTGVSPNITPNPFSMMWDCGEYRIAIDREDMRIVTVDLSQNKWEHEELFIFLAGLADLSNLDFINVDSDDVECCNDPECGCQDDDDEEVDVTALGAVAGLARAESPSE